MVETGSGVRERPILFSAPMVRAILDGRKTQTRRLVKPQPERRDDFREPMWAYQDIGVFGADDFKSAFVREVPCPYGVPGDRLWVRETWKPLGVYPDNAQVHIEYHAGGRDHFHRPDDWGKYYSTHAGDPWRPSIHMPRWASRITLELTDVRVERLHEITEADARAEGWHRRNDISPDPEVHSDAARDWFADAWQEINGKRESWGSNPWVWAISFRRVEA